MNNSDIKNVFEEESVLSTIENLHDNFLTHTKLSEDFMGLKVIDYIDPNEEWLIIYLKTQRKK